MTTKTPTITRGLRVGNREAVGQHYRKEGTGQRSMTTGERKPTPMLYLGLGGTVRDESAGPVQSPDDVVIYRDAVLQLRRFRAEGWRVIAVVNAGEVALGKMTPDQVLAIAAKTKDLCEQLIDKIGICFHHPDAPTPETSICWCRKPRPGNAIINTLMLAAEVKHAEQYPPHMALFVGDREEDAGCAQSMNVRFMNAADWRAGKFWEGR